MATRFRTEYRAEIGGLDERVQAILEAAVHGHAWGLLQCAKRCQSPIEQLLDLALRHEFLINPDVAIANQVPIEANGKTYYADIVVTYPGDNESELKIVVECDGHDYHERTKEQAARDKARDRAMQRLGYTVIRFTGSEIWRDPVGCAKEVWHHAIGWRWPELQG